MNSHPYVYNFRYKTYVTLPLHIVAGRLYPRNLIQQPNGDTKSVILSSCAHTQEYTTVLSTTLILFVLADGFQE